MKLVIINVIIGFIIIFSYGYGLGFAENVSARDIMQKVEDRDDGDNITLTLSMILIDKKGLKRKKYFKTFMKDFGKDTKRIMFIERPENVRNTGFLTFDYDDYDKDDDQWLFLPALGKSKRIASSDKSGSFMGSDLNYSDMTSRELDDYDFSILKEITLGGAKMWLIQAIPRSNDIIREIGYKKTVVAVRQDNYVVMRVKNWTNTGGYITLRDVKKIELIDGVWFVREMHVIKRRGKETVHKTILKWDNVKMNQEIEEDMFSLRRLEKGI